MTVKPRSSSSRPSSMPHPVPTEDTSMSDPTILSWGAGVNICEDLRRSIRTEIDDSIDPSIMNLHGNVKNEDRTSTQLAKDLSHARAEMLELRRSADDELDGAKMKDQVRTRLKATLKAELMTPMIDVNSSPDPSEESDNMDGSLSSTISAYLKQRASELKERASTVVVERESLVQIRATRDALEGENQSVLGRIESDRLLDQVAAEKKEVALHSEEFENETRRKRSTKGAVQQKRAECGQHAQQIADRTKNLTAKKTKNEAKKTEEALRVQQAEDRLRSSDSTAKVTSHFESISRRLATLNEELDAFEALRKEIEQVRAERRETEKETAQLAKSKDEQQDKINNGQSKYKASSTLLEQAKAAQSRVEAERVANDKVEAEDVLPGQIERNSLMEEKQELARTMNTLHEALVAFNSKHSKDLTDQSEALKELEEDYKLVSDGLAEKHSLAESIKYNKEQADAFAEKEQQEHEQFRTKFEEAVAAETKRLEEIKSERNKKRRERVEEARIKSSRMRSGLEVKLEILLLGVDEIAKVEQAAQ